MNLTQWLQLMGVLRHRHVRVPYYNSSNYCHSLLLTLAAFAFAALLFCCASASKEGSRWVGGVADRKSLGGPGSSPPTCRSKCGRCSPCTPVHVPIQPGLSVPLEYYPEAWRCKCGNKLFMP